MKRSRFSDEQIIGILKEQEAGGATADVRVSVPLSLKVAVVEMALYQRVTVMA